MATTSRAAKADGRDKKCSRSSQLFGEIANSTSRAAGRAPTFIVAVAVVVVWAITGPLFGYSDTWQLVINTGTTIVTFLMVFLIQNSQNRDGAAIQVKLDELIRVSTAHNSFVGIEHLTATVGRAKAPRLELIDVERCAVTRNISDGAAISPPPPISIVPAFNTRCRLNLRRSCIARSTVEVVLTLTTVVCARSTSAQT
jgi:low affinity Fe/Cu permease